MLATFEKGERLRHIGHLDIMRAMQRAIRRSGLPAAYSNGFNPHILLTFASALSVGVIGRREIMEVTLTEEVAPDAFMEAMNRALPPDMQLSSARAVDDRRPAAMSMVRAARYDIRIDGAGAAEMSARMPEYLEQQEIITERKTKSGMKPCDIRPLIHSLRIEDGHVFADLALTETESCKPGMLMATLSAFAGLAEEPRVLVTRLSLLGEDADGNLKPLEAL